MTNAGFALDYLEARHAETLAPVVSATDGPIRLLVAARIAHGIQAAASRRAISASISAHQRSASY